MNIAIGTAVDVREQFKYKPVYFLQAQRLRRKTKSLYLWLGKRIYNRYNVSLRVCLFLISRNHDE